MSETVIRMAFTVEEMKRFVYYLDIAANLIPKNTLLLEVMKEHGYDDPHDVLKELSDRLAPRFH